MMTTVDEIDAIELFGCAGGMAEGFRRAGLRFRIVIDFNPDACASYEANLGHRPIQRDIHEYAAMTRGDLQQALGRPSLIVADPPCTPWSRAGKGRGLADERDCLVATCHIIELLEPDAFLIANVPGLDDAPNWPHVQATVGAISGYCIHYAKRDAADYGVPQHRVRPFWYGHRRGRCIVWPEPTHCAPEHAATLLPGIRQLQPWITCGDALSHLSLEEMGRPVRMRWKPRTDAPSAMDTCPPKNADVIAGVPTHPPSDPSRPARTITSHNRQTDGGLISTPEVSTIKQDPKHAPGYEDQPSPTISAVDRCQGGSVLVMTGQHPPSRLDSPGHTIRAGSGTKGGDVLWLQELDRPSTTVYAGTSQLAPPGKGPPGSRRWPRNQDPLQRGGDAIVLSEKAAAILQGFPDEWVFVGRTKKTRWSQLGQAMPPSFAHAIAKSVLSSLDV